KTPCEMLTWREFRRVLFRSSRDVELSYRDGALEKVQDSTSRSVALELYVAGRYSAHRTTDLEPDRLRAFIREAVALTRALEPDEIGRASCRERVERRGAGGC